MAKYTLDNYKLNYMTQPSLDRSGWWRDLVRDIDNLPSIDLRQQLNYLFGPYLNPRPENILKCRDTLHHIRENLETIVQLLGVLLQPEVAISSAVSFQGGDMSETDIITSAGAAGPVLKYERSLYGNDSMTIVQLKDYAMRLSHHRHENKVKKKNEPDPLAARIIKHSGRVVAYHIEEFSGTSMYGVERIKRIGADPALTQAGVHTALIADLLLQTRNRFDFNSSQDAYSEDQTTMPKITQ